MYTIQIKSLNVNSVQWNLWISQNLNCIWSHTQTKHFRCSLCTIEFKTNGNLKQHVEVVHDKIKDIECVFCQKEYLSVAHIQRHILRHVKEKPYFCTLCERSFATGTDLKMHMPVHTGERAYKCDICGKITLTRKVWKGLKYHFIGLEASFS